MSELVLSFASFVFKIFIRNEEKRRRLEKDFRDLINGYRYGESGGLAREDQKLKERIAEELAEEKANSKKP